ncbi:MAG: stage III sporulation protein AA, partial [Bacillota bacterium]
INNIFNSLLNYSAYAYQEELANGYITIEGGHRVGICGRTVMENGRVKTIKDISSINIRRSREIIGVSDPCMGYLTKGKHHIYNTIIVSPPKCGKTTLLRDMVRNFSTLGFQVGVCDERSEISGMYNGLPSYNLGGRTDILDGCPKDKGMIMLIRSMSPDLIATDEIGKKEDCHAIEAAVCAGISLLTTIHGSSYEDVINSGIGEMVEKGVFERLIFLSNVPAIGSISAIRDWRNQNVI